MISGLNVKIRLAEQDDIIHACDIDAEAFSPYGTAELPSVIKDRWHVFPQGFIVAQYENLIVGYGTSEKWLSEREPAMNENPSESHHPEGIIFCVTAMAVRKEWRRRGVGSAILESLIQIAKAEKCRAILLETTHAQSFYLKRGFQITGGRGQMDADLAILKLVLD